jgi:hypothetical protein
MKFIWRKKILFFLLAFSLTLGLAWFFTYPASAQNLNTGINFVANTGLSNQDPRVTIANIIRIALGFLGVIAVGLIIYAGFIWMTAKGDEEKVGQARKIMTSAVIGLIIILAAFGIASFILSRLLGATGGGSTGGICSPACSANQYCCNSACQNTPCSGFIGGNDVFMVDGTTPPNQGINVIRNAVVRFHFTKGVANSSVNANSFTVTSGGTASIISGSRVVNGNYIEFTPDSNCEAPNDTIKCFPKNTVINVEAKAGEIISLDNKQLICSGSSLCQIQFTTGEIVDTKAPNVNITSQQICAAFNNTIRVSSSDDYGVAKIDFYVADNLIGSKINNSNPFVGSPFNTEISWNASGYQVGQNVKLKATAFDLDSNETSAEKSVRLSASHCCNGLKDGDETGVDCGGSCLACVSQACAADRGTPNQCSNALCASSYCSATGSNQDTCETAGYPKGTKDCCLCQAHPIIQWVSPADGAIGNFVTIAGSGFGTSRGKVFFSNNSIQGVEAKLADDATLGNPACADSVWKDNQIIAIVPSGANLIGPITIETSGGVSDMTNDAYGPLINDFKINTIDRPGICAISPGSGKSNDVLSYQGIKLTSAEAYYGNLASNVKAPVSSFSTSREGTATVPNINSGDTTTFVKAKTESNFLPFIKEAEPYTGPIISSIDPVSGPIGQYVTIRGSGFGDTRSTSKIFFSTSSIGLNGTLEADYSFPQVCAQSVWTDKQIIVKVPNGVSSGNNYKIVLKRDGFNDVDSGDKTFNITIGTPNPGLCLIQPILGQANSEVTLWGEYFKNKDDNSIIRFYNNLDQRGQSITYWNIDDSVSGIKPWKAITTIPQTATTGPVRIIAGMPAQVGNALNFSVGQCTKDSDCGAEQGVTCCAVGLPEAGKCKATATECYGTVATSVYEWRFSTGSQTSCAPDQEKCGTVCCTIGKCENASQNKCRDCLSSQNECGDGSCCNSPCQPGIGGGPSTCSDPTSCSGYSYNQCLEGYYCPNSPGLCSPYQGGNPVVLGQCGNEICNTKTGCENNTCHYDTTLNICVKNDVLTCKNNNLENGPGGHINGVGVCGLYNKKASWYLNNWTTSCPDGWTRLSGNRCVDDSNINGGCSVCSDPFTCEGPDTKGQCALKQIICPTGTTCDSKTNQCTKTDTGTCDCCCRKLPNPKADCCNGLNCEGSCGSGQSTLGLCTGCVVTINGVPTPDDSLCNCLGTAGKYCDNSANPKGVCKDCSSITDPVQCSKHDECCVDGKNNNRCTSVVAGGSRFQIGDSPINSNGLYYCAYYNCANTNPNTCIEDPAITGTYNKLTTCQMSCPTARIYCSKEDNCANPQCPIAMTCDLQTCTCKGPEPTVGQPCKDPKTQACTGKCSAGYQCLLPAIYSGGDQQTGTGGSQTDTGSGSSNTCLCCCKPKINPEDIDTCKQIDSSLNCLADKAPCSSPTKVRGLCCGCSKDKQCGDVTTTGCSTTDTCCRTRPTVTEHKPAVDATNVCRNTVIEAIFDQKMDITTFSATKDGLPNVALIADYGTTSCPSGYSVVAQAARPNGTLASIIFGAKKIIAKVFPSILTKTVLADIINNNSNYCYVPGSAVGYDINEQQSKVSFHLTTALDVNRKYYLVVMGDFDLTAGGAEKDYYNSRVTNLDKVGMIGLPQGSKLQDTFNSTTFKNSEIWSFTTGRDVCKLDEVTVSPSFQLFQKSGQTGSLNAYTWDHNNREIQAIANFYAWTWSWSSDDSSIATVNDSSTDVTIATAGNKQDAQTLGRAKATVTVDNFFQPATTGDFRQGIGSLRLFLCENPWPVYSTFPPDYQWPWQDSASGIEFYYCRDKSAPGTVDDLPALNDAPITKEGGRKICMFGSNVARVCTTDANCGNVLGSCLPEVLKEFFFFRENEPGIPSVTGVVDPVGKKVNLNWNATANASHYKIYYGLNSGQYVYTIDVPASGATISKTIDGLVNGLNYYFAVTAISSKNQESIFSSELKLKPLDTTPPAVPNLKVSAGDGKIALFWDKVTDATKYFAFLGTQPLSPQECDKYAIVTPFSGIIIANKPNVIFTSVNGSPLNNNTTYYVSVRSVDLYNNMSDCLPSIPKKPDEPYLISANSSGGSSIALQWLPFIEATGYNIYYGTQPQSRENSLSVSASTFDKNITGLTTNTTYYFRITATKAGANGESGFSNEKSAKPETIAGTIE